MNVYEQIVILDASLSDESLEQAVQRITTLITGSGGEMLKTDHWGRKKLGYEINKHTRGYYVLFLFKAPPDTIKKLEDLYKVFDPVVKYMVVRLEKKQKEATLRKLAEQPQPEAAPAASVAAPEAPAPQAESPAPTEE